MFKKIIGLSKDNQNGLGVNLNPLDILDGEKPGQKLIRFGRPDLVSGWASDLSAVSKKSQSQILEEVILQQFMPRNRTLQSFVDILYKDGEDITVAVGETIMEILSLRTAGDMVGENVDFDSLVKLIASRLIGHQIWYRSENYPKGKTDPMYHWMSNFEFCRNCLLDDEAELTPREEKRVRDIFDYLIDSWARGEGKEKFGDCPICNLINPIVEFWDKGLENCRGAYKVLFDAVRFALYEDNRRVFDIKDRLEVLEFINYIDVNGNVFE